jgi:dTDP-4-amino-4,6-dideoxygalactose transaminase
VKRFEEAFAAYVGARHAVAVNSCTAALHLSLIAAGIGPGDEVVTTPLTFCATANVIVHTGATPVFADIDPATGNIDPDAIFAALTPRTRAVLPVHYGGRPVDVEAIRAIARRRHLVVIEDAAHCIEGATAGEKIGRTADFTAFSFYATKNITTGEGGMVTTDLSDAADRMRVASLHGMTKNGWSRYERGRAVDYDVLMAGFKYNMSDLQAALGLHQLAAIDRHLVRRRAIAARYDAGLAALPIDRFAPVPSGTTHAHHLYTILVDGRAGRSRDDVADALAAEGISTSVHFPPVHLHGFYRDRYGFREGQFPHAERIARHVLSLPMSPAITDAQVDRVVAAVRRVFGV